MRQPKVALVEGVAIGKVEDAISDALTLRVRQAGHGIVATVDDRSGASLGLRSKVSFVIADWACGCRSMPGLVWPLKKPVVCISRTILHMAKALHASSMDGPSNDVHQWSTAQLIDVMDTIDYPAHKYRAECISPIDAQ